MKRWNVLLAAVTLMVAGVTTAQATMFGFKSITNTSVLNSSTGAAQLSVDVTAAGANQALFTFSNAGPLASSITDVYFDDGTLLGIANIYNMAGVKFAQYASPANLPGGNAMTPAFETTAGFSADSDSPVQPNGVNPGESLGVLFNLKNGGTFASVLSELGSGELRIGIHVQGFANGGSESFVNVPTAPVPAPGALLLGALGLGTIGWMKRRFV